jgi:hypothetical protein
MDVIILSQLAHMQETLNNIVIVIAGIALYLIITEIGRGMEK